MIKRSLLLLTVVLLYSSTLLAQQWTYSGTIPSAPDTINNNSGVQFVVVDANDRVWVNAFSSTGDSLFVPDSNKYKLVRPVYVYNPDGTLWKKIVSSTVGGVLYPFYGSGYGLEKDHNGNILVVKGGTMHRLDYQTGDGMTAPIMPFAGNSTASPAVDEAGNIYVVQVLPGAPLKKYDADFTFVSNIADTILDYGRYCEVSADGFTVYVPRYSANKVTRFRTTSEFDPYTADTILHGAAVESGEWDPVDPTKIWFSVGHAGYNPPTGTFEGRLGTYLMFDTATWAFTDSIKWQANVDYVNERPRGLAFSLDGTKAYIAEFGTSLPHPVQVFVNPQHVVGVEKEEGLVVESYSLGQNYPNPFNPSTSINFTVVNSGLVTVKVYDLLGKEVATLVNEELSNGSYNVSFDASKLASGTYVYRMTANGTQLSKKMMLVK
jgi:hypothetical protein